MCGSHCSHIPLSTSSRLSRATHMHSGAASQGGGWWLWRSLQGDLDRNTGQLDLHRQSSIATGHRRLSELRLEPRARAAYANDRVPMREAALQLPFDAVELGACEWPVALWRPLSRVHLLKQRGCRLLRL